MLRSVWLLAAVVAVAGACLVAPALAGAATFSNGTTIPINDGGGCGPSPAFAALAPGLGNPYPSQITVSGVPGLVTNVTATLTGLTHTFPKDVDVLLVGPGGQSTILMADSGGPNPGVSGVTLTFDDSAATPIPDSSTPASGSYQPAIGTTGDGDGCRSSASFPAPAPAGPYGAPSLSVFDGTGPNGTWSLYVIDDAGFDTGSISGGWSLAITAANPVVFNASLCVNGGWQHLMRANGTAFQSQFHCTQYAAFHGTIYALSQIHVTASAVQPADGLSVSTSGFGLQPGSAVVTRILQNGQQVAFNSLNADANGQVDGSPFGFINAPCVDGNVYSATATGTSADSVSIPKAPGIPITSNTVMRTSSCP